MQAISNVKELARLLRERRRALNITQDDLALLAGLGRAAVIRFENHPDKVQLQTVFRIAKALKIEIFANFNDAAEAPKPDGGEGGVLIAPEQTPIRIYDE